MAWIDWANGVLSGVGAPPTATNIETLWAWSNKESGADVMRWNNPLNTTEELIAGQDIDPDMNRVGVEAYPTVGDGVIATVATLKNGLYPIIVEHLQASVPRSQWADACGELGTWGTGCDWLTQLYGSPPEVLTADMTRADMASIIRVALTLMHGAVPDDATINHFADIAQARPEGVDAAIVEILGLSGAKPATVGAAGPAGQPGPAGPPGPAGTIPPHDHGIAANTTEPFTP